MKMNLTNEEREAIFYALQAYELKLFEIQSQALNNGLRDEDFEGVTDKFMLVGDLKDRFMPKRERKLREQRFKGSSGFDAILSRLKQEDREEDEEKAYDAILSRLEQEDEEKNRDEV